jgi:hypothetical protein
LPECSSDDTIRAAPHQVTAAGEPVREVLRRNLEQGSSLGVSVAFDTLEQIGMAFDFNMAHARASRWASAYSYELVRDINATTTARLQVAVQDWFNERTTLPDLVKEIEPLFGRKRAKLISQTETTRSAAMGAIEGYREAGIADQQPTETPPAHPGCRCWLTIRINDDNSADYIWLTANDGERVCRVCGPRHGKSMGVAKAATS